MVTELFRKNNISDAQARKLFDVMEWLVLRNGPPSAPQIQSPLQKAHQTVLNSRWEPLKTRSLSLWAKRQFADLKQAAGMGHWAVQILPAIDSKCALEHLHIDHNWNPAARGPYYIDEYGRAVITFEPKSCAEAGAFTSHILMKLASIRMMNFMPPMTGKVAGEDEKKVEVDLEMGAIIILASAAFSGQGLYLLPMADSIAQQLSANASSKLSKDSIENGLIFNSCLCLLALNRTSEQIVATYGNLGCPILRQKIRSVCRQIERLKPELQRLKESVNPKRETHLALPWKKAS